RRSLLIAARCVYRARYFSTTSGPPNGSLAYTTQSVRAASDTSPSNSSIPAGGSGPPRGPTPPPAEAAPGPPPDLPPTPPPRQPPRREQEAGAAAHPAVAPRREAAPGDDAMDVGMQLQVLPPGVQHRQHTDLGPQVLRVRSHLDQGLRGGPQQQAVDLARVGQG